MLRYPIFDVSSCLFKIIEKRFSKTLIYWKDTYYLAVIIKIENIFIDLLETKTPKIIVWRLLIQWRTVIFWKHMQLKKCTHPPNFFFNQQNILVALYPIAHLDTHFIKLY